ncbi:hypothetical protein L615_005000000310 [Nocardioides sp. J9]|nr:hypothetical protein L615_005000000310 [Nocardioides sp. J9]
MAAALVLLVGGVAAGWWWQRDDEPSSERPTPRAEGPGAEAELSAAEVLEPGTVLATDLVRPPRLEQPVALPGRLGGVAVPALGVVPAVGTGEERSIAPDGHRLVAFTLADGPCQARGCRGWARLGLRLVVGGGAARALPAGGPTFVAVAPDDAPVQLVFAADGVRQAVSLPGGKVDNQVAVLVRPRLAVDIGLTDDLAVTADQPLAAQDRSRRLTVGEARLFFFAGRKGPQRTDRAYLAVDVSYTRSGDPTPSYFDAGHLSLRGPDGKRFPRRDVKAPTLPRAAVFLVPADFSRGTLVVGGTTRVATLINGVTPSSVLLTVEERTVPVRIPAR